jgi:hypothetical protein
MAGRIAARRRLPEQATDTPRPENGQDGARRKVTI